MSTSTQERDERERIFEEFLHDEKAYLAYINRKFAQWDYNSLVNFSRKEGEDRAFRLAVELFKAGRLEDITKASSDKTYRDKLYQEFNIQYPVASD